MTAWSDERTSDIVGFANGLGMPKLASDGPVATIATVLGAEPPITKPLIITLFPVCTCPRVDRFPSRGGLGLVVEPTVNVYEVMPLMIGTFARSVLMLGASRPLVAKACIVYVPGASE